MNNLNPVQIAIIAAAVFITVVAILIFSGVLPGLRPPGESEKAQITFWADLPEETIRPILTDFHKDFSRISVKYEKMPTDGGIEKIIDSLAAGTGPDVWLMPASLLLLHKDKIYPIKTELYSRREFQDNFIEGAEIFLIADNIMGLPFAVDPLTMFWNRDLFKDAGIAKTPETWDEFITAVSKLSKIDAQNNIIQAGTALGEFQNIKNAKDILTLLILQTQNPIVKYKISSSGEITFQIVLSQQFDQPLNPAVSSIRFFNEFSNINKSSYTWNKAMPEALEVFLQGRLGMYFDRASRYEEIQKKNPHLNFDIAEVPQIRGAEIKTTNSQFKALVISKQSPNKAAAFEFIKYMSGKKAQTALAKLPTFTPPIRQLLAAAPDNPFKALAYTAAVKAVSWLDPNPLKTNEIFQNMIESVSSGRKEPDEAVNDAEEQLEAIVQNLPTL